MCLFTSYYFAQPKAIINVLYPDFLDIRVSSVKNDKLDVEPDAADKMKTLQANILYFEIR